MLTISDWTGKTCSADHGSAFTLICGRNSGTKSLLHFSTTTPLGAAGDVCAVGRPAGVAATRPRRPHARERVCRLCPGRSHANYGHCCSAWCRQQHCERN